MKLKIKAKANRETIERIKAAALAAWNEKKGDTFGEHISITITANSADELFQEKT